MRSFQIQDQLGFMKKLLVGETFDTFLLSEASITTYASFHVDGTFHPDYFGETEARDSESYTRWKRVRPIFLELTKGKHRPLRFRIIFRLAPHNVLRLLSQNGLPLDPAQVDGLFLNISFDGSALSCTSGVSLRIFSLDKTLEHCWDGALEKFFLREGIPFA